MPRVSIQLEGRSPSNGVYKRVLNHPLQDSINAVRAGKMINVPVVMTREDPERILMPFWLTWGNTGATVQELLGHANVVNTISVFLTC